MSRLPLVGDEVADEGVARVFARFAAEGRAPIDLYRALANAPYLLGPYSQLAQALRNEARTDRTLRELLIMRVAHLTGSEYEWSHHRALAEPLGIDAELAAAVRDWEASDAFDARQRACLRCADRVHELELDERSFAELRRHCDPAEAAEVIVLVAFYEFVARLIDGFGIAVEPAYRRYLDDAAGAQG